MIQNIIQTNANESLELLSAKMFVYLFLLGILPSYLIYKLDINYESLTQKIKTIFVSLAIIISILFLFSKYYTSFFREHKPLRYYTNPTFWIYSMGKFITHTTSNDNIPIKLIGTDAIVTELDGEDDNHTELVIMVVGEAARADHFSLNGYEKETNPLLKKENIINFSNVYSCGTATAISVPCMFSIFDKADYSYKKGKTTEDILDVLNHTNYINILWRDNNSDSKGVASRLKVEDFKTSKTNTICDIECRDEGMLVGLDNYIDKHKDKDILIVLHQMGNHGPSYYKRYPKKFEKFKPVCKTNQLEECSKEEISNAYDNALLYTDYFLSKVISFLKRYDNTYEVAMLYMSDHGESLGENGLYLHGLPYFIAPENQKHIGTMFWFGENMLEDIDIEKLKNRQDEKFTHDNLFHTLLGIFEVNSSVYNQKMDILKGCYTKEEK
jgi:lipid A ethanolaminephosphotransferase